jgi:hypothetical protein
MHQIQNVSSISNSINAARLPITLKPKNMHESKPRTLSDNDNQSHILKESTDRNFENNRINMAYD